MLRASDARSADPLLNSPLGGDDEENNDDDRVRRSYLSSNRRTSPLPSSTTTTSLHPRIAPSFASTPTDLPDHGGGGGHRPTLARRATATSTTMSSRSPHQAAAAARLEARKKYTYAAFFLVVSLVTFTVQTELASYIQHDLGWDKAYCMLYLTHGSWVLLWPLQLGVLWLQQRRRRRRELSWRRFWDGHVRTVQSIALVVETRDGGGKAGGGGGSGNSHHHGAAAGGLLEYGHSPWPYLVKTTVFVTTALTVAGLSWYLAVSMTTPSDLTAIYNCSAFFAYAFSVPLLKERLRADKLLAVAVAIVGVLVVAYGDGGESSTDDKDALNPATRFAGNIIIGVGSVLYGLYEVLYKRYACPPDGTDATKGVIFANTFGSLVGAFTLFVLWIPLPVLHVLGWETFEIPTGETAWLLFISVIMNMMFSGSFLVLISLTSPVLSSVAGLLTIFTVAIVDWWWTGTPLSAAAVFGGLMIVAAFGMLSWSTWREMNEEERRKQVDLSGDEDG
ncbi:hypothetical protein C8A00DRAFT_17202 [Chaetomidium leptoderma]|uniref:EamA domain-containing protein n=1 Tax=Chaetomidium leptoderma TaxID=669021 RepID=A0AAN6VH44_9PEZI|nr:hypothetical protein C8A00DRAFT_17202 [Chaetomidium leptoderma]